MLVEVPVEESVEHKLRILLVVAYLSLITQSLALLGKVQSDGVDAGAVIVQRVEMTGTIDTSLG